MGFYSLLLLLYYLNLFQAYNPINNQYLQFIPEYLKFLIHLYQFGDCLVSPKVKLLVNYPEQVLILDE